MYLLVFNFSLHLSFMIFLISTCLLTSDLRKKFIFFLLSLVLFSMFGFLFDLDGIFLIFLTAELTIFLLFLMTYTQLYNNYTFINTQRNYYFILLFLIILLNVNPTNSFYFFLSYYKTLNNIVSADFYILYYFLFDQIPFITVSVVLIISFFSIFFILMYFSLKLVKNYLSKNYKYTYFLRKQHMVKQTTFNTKLYVFQN